MRITQIQGETYVELAAKLRQNRRMKYRPSMLAYLPLLIATALFTTVAFAHPEDELCLPGVDGLDPALCEALQDIDRPASAAVSDGGFTLVLDDDGQQRGMFATLLRYVAVGTRHILPGGTDHILFVLAIFLASTRTKNLVLQVSAFTVAHTATLALAAAGVLSPSPAIVEPLIAATIGFVAIENLFSSEMTRWRPAIVFGFGLIHGLGFAGFFGELGLPPGQFWSALLGFNIGVEIGQLSVIAVAAVLVLVARRRFLFLRSPRQYRHIVVLPGSALIGLTGLWWTLQRITQ